MAAGVQIGDILLMINNFDCRHATPDQVTEYINRSSANGQPITLTISRSATMMSSLIVFTTVYGFLRQPFASHTVIDFQL